MHEDKKARIKQALKSKNTLKELRAIVNLKPQGNGRDRRIYEKREHKNIFYWSGEWRRLKKEVINRDHKECQVSKRMSGAVVREHLLVHHIYPIESYPELRLEEWNLITVCSEVHNMIHATESADRWDEDEWF